MSIGTTSLFAWHGWRLWLPRSWNPVKLEGDYTKGLALFADMDRARLGLRWDTPRQKKFDPDAWTKRAVRNEVGQLAADEAIALPSRFTFHISRLYLDPDPPGRDVFVAHSTLSNRVIEIIHHAHKRTRTLEESILPTLADTAPDAPTPWSIFDLTCTSPANYRLKSHRLNAGDLALTFARKHDWLTVRQIALAALALSRKPLDKWLADQLRTIEKHYAPGGNLAATTLSASARELSGFTSSSTRRTRFAWMGWLPRHITTFALHDLARDRIVIAQGTTEDLLRDLASTVGRNYHD
jgi:hypothetical protein